MNTRRLAPSLLVVTLAWPSVVRAECRDQDGDGYGPGCALGDDCNDLDPGVHPGAVERCDLVDQDCNGLVDDSPICPAVVPVPGVVVVPAGPFIMGSDHGAPDEAPEHTVRVSAFRLDRHEVTNARYAACVRAGACIGPALLSSRLRPHYFDEPRFGDYPVIFVSWEQAEAFCRFAGGRLPTEAEWEKAARGPAPSKRVYPWGDDAPDCTRANMGGPQSCLGDTDLVGRRPAGASPYGALDMAGNVWEWVADRYDPGWYARTEGVDPRGPAAGTLRVMRGGCWESAASNLRVSCRKAELPQAWADNVGFRCAYEGS
jgi:formylglycine-generating enzyme required for sulfatase activity